MSKKAVSSPMKITTTGETGEDSRPLLQLATKGIVSCAYQDMISTGLRSLRRPWCRSLSSAASAAKETTTENVRSSPAPPSSSEAANCFNAIMYKGGKNKLIGIRELKTLLNICRDEQNGPKYAGLGVDWYQKKGFDFSEELNSLFVDACLSGNNPKVAVSRFIYGKGRIGAWSTPKTLNKLFKSLRDNNDAESMVSVLETLIPKGVRINNVTLSLCLGACAEVNSRELYLKTIEIVSEGQRKDFSWDEIKARYPLPEEVIPPPEDEVASEAEENNADKNDN